MQVTIREVWSRNKELVALYWNKEKTWAYIWQIERRENIWMESLIDAKLISKARLLAQGWNKLSEKSYEAQKEKAPQAKVLKFPSRIRVLT